MMYLRLDLKVCEACGTLWLRSQEKNSVYCSRCAARLQQFPIRAKHPGGRPRRSRTLTRGSAHTAGGAR